MSSLQRQIRSLRQQVTTDRFLSLALEVRGPSDDVIVRAGGVWDRLRQEFSDQTPVYHVVRVTKAQEKAARQVAQLFEAFERGDPDRVALEVYVDLRRGGKTFFLVLAVLLFLLRYPRTALGGTVGWLVTPTYPQQRELQETLGKIVPPAWLREGGPIRFAKSERTYHFATGAVLQIKSADRPETMKAGGVGIIGINEAQQLTAQAVLHCLGANIDLGTWTLLAMNPPNTVRGLWAEDLHDAINAVDEQGRPQLPWARETAFPAKHNNFIDQAARRRFAALAAVLDPKQAQRDAGDGDRAIWVSIKDRAYPHYDRAKHLRLDLPLVTANWQDVTADFNAMTEYLRRGDARPWGIGMDFQWRPYCAAVKAKVLVAPAGNVLGIPPGPVYVFFSECVNDPSAGQWWTEEGLCREMLAQGWEPETALVIGDGTGATQGAQGAQRGRDADPATFSFPIVRSFGFEIHAPLERVEYERRKQKGTQIEVTCSNPRVTVRVNCVNEVLQQGRMLIGPEALETAEAFRRCEARGKKPYGRWAHLTDSAGYLIWKWETLLRELQQGRLRSAELRGLLPA